MAVTTTVTVTVNTRETLVDGDNTAQDKFSFTKTYTFADAAGVLGATKVWADYRTITGTDTLDVAGGVVDKLGQTEAFAKEKMLLLHHGGSTGTLTLGGGSNPAVGLFTGTIPLGADGLVLIVNPTAAGGAVTAGTGDVHQIVASVAATPATIAAAAE
jgi:hypothetical protein